MVALKVAVPWLQALHEALALQACGLGSQRKLPESDSSTEVTQHHFHCTLLVEMDTSLPGFKGKELRPHIFMKGVSKIL